MSVGISSTSISFSSGSQSTAFYTPILAGALIGNPTVADIGLTSGFYTEILTVGSLLAGTYLFMYTACFLCPAAFAGNAQYLAFLGTSGQGTIAPASFVPFNGNQTIGVVKASAVSPAIQYISITKYTTITVAAGAVSLYMGAPTGKTARTSASLLFAWRLS